jgi:hypothetical protein
MEETMDLWGIDMKKIEKQSNREKDMDTLTVI